MLIDKKDIQPGTNLIFKRARKDYMGLSLSLLLKLFNPKWDIWGWHMAFVASAATLENVQKYNDLYHCNLAAGADDWIIMEATWPCCRLNNLSRMGEQRAYKWLDRVPEQSKIDEFIKEHIGERYDILLYPWTAVQYIFRHFWNKPIPRLLDNHWTCWELVVFFDLFMGKMINSVFDCPVICDIQKELER